MSAPQSPRCINTTKRGEPCALAYRHRGVCKPHRNDNTMALGRPLFEGVDPLARLVAPPWKHGQTSNL